METNKNYVVFDSLYFRGQKAKLNIGKIGYIASFKTSLNQKKVLIMDSDVKQEYGIEPEQYDKSVTFKLEENQCVIQYTESCIFKYYKYIDVVENKQNTTQMLPITKKNNS